ncbi:MAG TPA: hypothetical protein G4O18_06650 [Dehalococcoidia bacterium]|nr:hypothetical protein [Dehalococcoidia bacterium]
MRFGLPRRKKVRGKGISPETKSRNAKARTDAYLSDVWLKMLRQDPELAKEIAKAKFGVEVSVGENHDYTGYEPPDLLETLRQAREARDLIRDELEPEGKGSVIRDIAEVMRYIPAAIQMIKQQQAPQEVYPPVQRQQLAPQQLTGDAYVPKPAKKTAILADLLEVSELTPQQAYDKLQGTGWQQFLKENTFGQLVDTLKTLEVDPQFGSYVTEFLEQKSDWLRELSAIANKTGANSGQTYVSSE